MKYGTRVSGGVRKGQFAQHAKSFVTMVPRVLFDRGYQVPMQFFFSFLPDVSEITGLKEGAGLAVQEGAGLAVRRSREWG